MSVGFEFLGNLSVKNIDETVPSYAVRIGGQPADQAAPSGRPSSVSDATRGLPPKCAGRPARAGGRCAARLPLPRKLAGLGGRSAPGWSAINLLTCERHVLGTLAAAGASPR